MCAPPSTQSKSPSTPKREGGTLTCISSMTALIGRKKISVRSGKVSAVAPWWIFAKRTPVLFATSAKYICKAGSKGGDFVHSWEKSSEFFTATRNQRFFGVVGEDYGKVGEIRKGLREEGPVADSCCCPVCGRKGRFVGTFDAADTRYSATLGTHLVTVAASVA